MMNVKATVKMNGEILTNSDLTSEIILDIKKHEGIYDFYLENYGDQFHAIILDRDDISYLQNNKDGLKCPCLYYQTDLLVIELRT